MYKEELYQSCFSIKNETDLINNVSQDKLYYPQFHIAPKFGLLNDPNGLCYFQGEYHIFYQYHPNNVAHGMKNWNHVTTKDFITFKDHGIKLYPEHEYENYGIFSGSAKVVGEQVYLYYTANHRDPETYIRKPNQCLAIMDKDYKIISKEIILQYNDQYSEHYRDPFVYGNDNILIGAQTLAGRGCLSIVDREFNKRKITLKNNVANSYMIECPNYINIDGENILICSPQGVNDDKFQNIHSVVYIECNINESDTINNDAKLLDYGFDYYAPQVFFDGCMYILIPWVGQADTIYPYDEKLGWSQVLGMPRELKYVNQELLQIPLKSCVDAFDMQLITEDIIRTTRSYRIKMKMEHGSKLYLGFDNKLIITYLNGIFTLDRSDCDVQITPQFGEVRTIEIIKDIIDVEIFVDNSMIEIFIDGGSRTMASRFFIEKLEVAQFVRCYNIEYGALR